AKEKIGMFEADDGHGYNKGRRLAAYDWLARWLKGTEDKTPEPEIEMSTPEELRATPTGQVATSLGGESVFTLNQKRLEQAKATRIKNPEELARKVQKVIGYKAPNAPLQQNPYGTLSRSGYHIERLIYESEPGIVIPSLLYVPDAGAGKKAAVLMVTGDGKADSASEAEQFVKAGVIVLSIDARGFGESRVSTDVNSRDFDHYFGDFDSAMTALMIYDLPDLVATLAPREVWIINGTDPLGHELPASEISKEYSRALDAFRQAKAEESIHIRDRRFEEDVTTTYREFADGR